MAKQSLGGYCDRLGLSAQHLIDQHPAIKDDNLTNGMVLEIVTKQNYLLMFSSVLSYSKYPHQRNEVIVTPASL